MVLTGLCCICTGMIAILTSHMPGDTRSAPAGRLTRALSLFGAGAAITAGLTGIPYRWLTGDIGFDTFLVVEIGLLVLFAAWVVAAAVMMRPARRVRPR